MQAASQAMSEGKRRNVITCDGRFDLNLHSSYSVKALRKLSHHTLRGMIIFFKLLLRQLDILRDLEMSHYYNILSASSAY